MEIQIKRDEKKMHMFEFNEIEVSILKTALKQLCTELDKTIFCPDCKKRTRNMLKRITKLDDDITFELVKESTNEAK